MAVTMDSDPLQEDQIRRAQRVVASFSVDADEASEFMLMLGIHPEQEQPTRVRDVYNLPNPNSAL